MLEICLTTNKDQNTSIIFLKSNKYNYSAKLLIYVSKMYVYLCNSNLRGFQTNSRMFSEFFFRKLFLSFFKLDSLPQKFLKKIIVNSLI